MARCAWFTLLLVGCGTVDLPEEADDCGADRCVSGRLGEWRAEAGEETNELCFSWTVGNDEPLLVNSVAMHNGGSFHHSNWFWVPEDAYDAPDGVWPCRDQDFSEVEATLLGGVLFAQSTQVTDETQQFLPGAAVRVGERARIIANAHILHAGTEPLDTFLDVTLGLLEPENVTAPLVPIRFNYGDLDIPAGSVAEHRGDCEMASLYTAYTGEPFTPRLHYVLSHFHSLGVGFELALLGGDRDGEVLFSQEEAYGHPLGHTFAEPVDMAGSEGISVRCLHDNPRAEWVGPGIGDQEMCVMLGFLESPVMYDVSVRTTTTRDTAPDGTALRSGDCFVLGAEPPR